MRKRHLVIVLLAVMCGPAFAAEPIGEWLVADGGATIRIDPCADALWGAISWVREPGFDSQNPDPAKRSRSIVGVPILRSMKAVGVNRWEGEVYNAQNGKMYSANISLLNDDVLKIQGCVLGGLFCGGENWTRVVQPAAGPAPAARPGSKQTPPAKPKPAAVCSYE
jgi:uncharacterized protein (DUF2147 family)